jgi:hypothetical protein
MSVTVSILGCIGSNTADKILEPHSRITMQERPGGYIYKRSEINYINTSSGMVEFNTGNNIYTNHRCDIFKGDNLEIMFARMPYDCIHVQVTILGIICVERGFFKDKDYLLTACIQKLRNEFDLVSEIKCPLLQAAYIAIKNKNAIMNPPILFDNDGLRLNIKMGNRSLTLDYADVMVLTIGETSIIETATLENIMAIKQ